MSEYPLQMEITQKLARYCAQLSYEAIPEKTKKNACIFYVDYIASVHAGHRINADFNQALVTALDPLATTGSSHVFFQQAPTSALNAAFINAVYAHGADLDDGNKKAAGHVGVHIISALMALAEDRSASVGAFVTAMVAGYDVYCRLSAACMPHLVNRGFHSTGTAGTVAVAAACAKLLGLESQGIACAIALSASQASGLLLVGETGQEAKPLNPANAARSGMLAALLAEQGVVGPEKPLESAKGWCAAMTPAVKLDVLLDGLGKNFALDECYLKPYPACRHVHSAIEAGVTLREQLAGRKINRATIRTYSHAIDLAGISLPQTVSEAKFSLGYGLATALVKGNFTLCDLSVQDIDPEIKSVIKRIDLIADESYERPSEGVRGCCVSLIAEDGSTFECTVLAPKGEPENPFSLQDLIAKMQACCLSGQNQPVEYQQARSFVDQLMRSLENPQDKFVFPRNTDWEGC